MGTTYLYRLAPRTAFHFGLRGVGVEETAAYCPADTLFSALCLTMQQWDPGGNQALEAWLARFPAEGRPGLPPLRLSSAFPYAGPVLFFPKPMLPANLAAAVQDQDAKKLKKVEYVSTGILKHWLAWAELTSQLRSEQLLHRSSVWVTLDELHRLDQFRDLWTGKVRMWTTQGLPRVSVDRQTSRSTVYQAGVVRFKPGAGLFVLVELLDGDVDAQRQALTTQLQVLGHDGLGGERSSGYGQFDLEGPEVFDGLGPATGDHFLTLSPYHPTEAEVAAGVLGQGAAYKLQTRRGWVGAPGSLNWRRRAVRLIAEGSALRQASGYGSATYGDLVDVGPQDEDGHRILPHRVWRYGLAFPVPALWPGEEAS